MALLFPRLAFPDERPCASVGERTLTYRRFAELAAGHAARASALGVRRGDVVGVVAHGDLETMVAIVGGVCAGFVTLPLNPKLGESERATVLADAAPKAVFSSSPSAPGELPLSLEPGDAPLPARELDHDEALLLYTSGTTGAPKGVPLTARNLSANLDGLARAWRLTDADTLVHALPLFHVHGLVLGLFGALRAGAGFVHLPRFEPDALCAALAHGTVLYAVPTMYHRIADAAERDASLVPPLARARLLVSGSAPLSTRDHARIEALTGRGVHERYGLTETLIDCAIPADAAPRPGYVGPAVPGVELRLVDEARATVTASDDATLGEVAVRGPCVFAGYRNRPEANAEVLDADGWFYTGDLATRSADGWFRIVGRRATDLVKTGGYKVGAGEIETCLLGHPDVAECAVVGRPDDDLGERIVAFVVPKPGARPDAAALVAHVGAQLAPHKRPREVRFVSELPRNAMGKVQKKLLP